MYNCTLVVHVHEIGFTEKTSSVNGASASFVRVAFAPSLGHS